MYTYYSLSDDTYYTDKYYQIWRSETIPIYGSSK